MRFKEIQLLSVTLVEMEVAVVQEVSSADESLADFERRAKELDDALEGLDNLDERSKKSAYAIKDSLESYYIMAVKRAVEILLGQGDLGLTTLRTLSSDPIVRALFTSAGVIQTGPTERVFKTLASVKPYLDSAGVSVEVVNINLPEVLVRLRGNFGSCSSSKEQLLEEIQEIIISNVGEVSKVRAIDDNDPDLLKLSPTRRKIPQWEIGPALEDIVDYGVLPFTIGEERLILTSVAGELSCFRNRCAHLGMELDRATLDVDGTLVCPWHRFCFDAISGECLTIPGVELEKFSVRVEDGSVMVKLK